MATSVLGKRPRSLIDSQAESPSTQTRKRRGRISTPRIHEEDGVSSVPNLPKRQPMGVDGPLHGSSKSRTVSTKRTVPNRCTLEPQSISTGKDTSVIANDENAPPVEFKTPSAVRFRDALAPTTPKHRVKLFGKPLTPRTPRTGPTPSSKRATVYTTARQLFAQSGSQTRLIGRDAERAKLTDFISMAVNTRSGGSTYVSGPPGTGKTALVEEVTRDASTTYDLKTSVVNCVSAKSSKDILQKIISDVCPHVHLGTQSEQSFLSKLFLPQKRSTSGTFLVVLDEVDNLLSLDSEALYALFDWALTKSSRLILIGIANALDFTDRFLPRLKAKNLRPRLLSFMPYTASQIASIITGKLRSTLSADSTKSENYVPFLHPAAVQLCSKKVASQTGDLRSVFNLVRRAIDRIEHETIEDCAATERSPSKQPFEDITNRSPTTQLPLSPPSSSPLKAGSEPTTPSKTQADLTRMTAESAPRATVAHVARLTAAIFNNDATSRLDGLNLQQKAVICSLVAAEKKRKIRDPFSTPSKTANRKPMLKDLFQSYAGLCKREDVLCPLSATEFRDVVWSLDTLGLVHEANARANFLTPTKTPSRLSGRSVEDKQFASSVTEKELEERLQGPGSEILKRLLHGKIV